MNFYRVTGCLLVAMFLVGCASRPVNERITQVDPQAGYRPHLLIPKRQNNEMQTFLNSTVLPYIHLVDGGSGTTSACAAFWKQWRSWERARRFASRWDSASFGGS